MELKAPTLNDLKGLVLTALAVVLLWNYILFFLEPATEMVIQIARSIILPSGLESNEAYYPLETTVKYICPLYTSPSPRDLSTPPMPSSS